MLLRVVMRSPPVCQLESQYSEATAAGSRCPLLGGHMQGRSVAWPLRPVLRDTSVACVRGLEISPSLYQHPLLNYPFRDPRYHRIETRRSLIEVHWRLVVCSSIKGVLTMAHVIPDQPPVKALLPLIYLGSQGACYLLRSCT